MKDETLDKANELKGKISAAAKILSDTVNQQADIVTFSTGMSGVVVCTNTDLIENIRTLLIKVHEDNLKRLQDEFNEL